MKRFWVQTFGCQMNVHDSRRIEEVLHGAGWAEAPGADEADLIVFNTCSVREKAEHKLMSALGKTRPHKEGRGTLVAVAGCVAQQEGERLLKKTSLIDVIVGPDNIPELPALVDLVKEGGPPMTRTVFDSDDPRFLVATPRAAGREVTAFVTVMKGCDERCTYCVVPYTRGPERYRPAREIIDEIRGLCAGGVREVTLLGQTVNSWYDPSRPAPSRSRAAASLDGDSAPRPSEFAGLLRTIAEEIPELWRLRYTSPHPRHLTDELISAHRDLPVLPQHLHLPVQSGNDVVLKRMLRRYTRQLFLERVGALKEAVPGLTLSTDIIVGFPGETDAQFEDTLSLTAEAGFVSVFAFKYSPRPHTPSLKLTDDVPEAVKDTRLQALFETVGIQQRAHLNSLVDSEQEVLIEGLGKNPLRHTGRTYHNEIVHVLGPTGVDLAGQRLQVRIVEANKHSLMGEVIGEFDDSRLLETKERAPTKPQSGKSHRKLPVLPGDDR